MNGTQLLNQNGQPVQIHLAEDVYNFKIFKYTNKRLGMYLEDDKGRKTYVTVNDSAKKVKEGQFYLRDHDQFKGLDNFLYNEGVVEFDSKHVYVGVKDFKICKIINNG